MYVTTDALELEKKAQWSPVLRGWQERLVVGVALYGRSRISPERSFDLLRSASELTCVQSLIDGVTIVVPGREYKLSVKGAFRGIQKRMAADVEINSVLVSGCGGALQFGSEGVFVGGEVSQIKSLKYDRVGASFTFCFPYVDSKSFELAERLLSYVAGEMDADYGYAYLRDAAGFPRGYSVGVALAIFGGIADVEAQEITSWGRYIDSDFLSESLFRIRDAYEINFLSHEYCRCQSVELFSQGELVELSSGKLWRLSTAEMEFVRDYLYKAGSIRSLMPRVYRQP